jgi:hypothetical protein
MDLEALIVKESDNQEDLYSLFTRLSMLLSLDKVARM